MFLILLCVEIQIHLLKLRNFYSNKEISSFKNEVNILKETKSKKIAKYLKFVHIDTGSMYRAFTLFAIENGLYKKEIFNNTFLYKHLTFSPENYTVDIRVDLFKDKE